ncbi:hypothetical protein [Legionella sp. PL877]|nr:hypothetical protein [Legionella sp. PL877]MDI9817622.1 hypothetical protein [Legionella sp. PL877]
MNHFDFEKLDVYQKVRVSFPPMKKVGFIVWQNDQAQKLPQYLMSLND